MVQIPNLIRIRYQSIDDELQGILLSTVDETNFTDLVTTFFGTKIPLDRQPTKKNIKTFHKNVAEMTKPKLCARLTQYYLKCRDKEDMITKGNWFTHFRELGPIFATSDRNCYGVESLYRSTRNNRVDPYTQKRQKKKCIFWKVDGIE
jgi:hypothetical protein